MADLSAREIYRFARLAGFTPDQATTMTAIALAESGGNSHAHNSSGEDSRGLWQINVAAHGDWAARRDLYDPLENAKAAYRISGGGRDVSPWTTTHGRNARYLAHRSEAQAAARSCGDDATLGVWTGTAGYGHPMAAGGTDGESGGVRTFLDAALAQAGDRYVFGAEARASDPDPDVFDCSELVQWAGQRAGVSLPDGSWLQYLHLQRQGATLSVEQALKTPGALLFSFSERPTAGGGRPSSAHVAISLGDGRTIEAKGTQYGVGSWAAGNRFQYAAVIPGLSGGTATGSSTTGSSTTGGGAPATTALAMSVGAGAAAGTDADRDGLTDELEARLGLSGTRADSDRDNLSDGYELLRLRTDPKLADSDRDGLGDGMELAAGTRSTDPDSDRDGRLDGAEQRPERIVDADGDGVTDPLEALFGSDADALDSDRDGFTDGAEYQAFFDPTDAASNPLTGQPATASGAAATRGTSAAGPAGGPQSWGLDDLDG